MDTKDERGEGFDSAPVDIAGFMENRRMIKRILLGLAEFRGHLTYFAFSDPVLMV